MLPPPRLPAGGTGRRVGWSSGASADSCTFMLQGQQVAPCPRAGAVRVPAPRTQGGADRTEPRDSPSVSPSQAGPTWPGVTARLPPCASGAWLTCGRCDRGPVGTAGSSPSRCRARACLSLQVTQTRPLSHRSRGRGNRGALPPHCRGEDKTNVFVPTH